MFDIIRFFWRPKKTQSALTFGKLAGYQFYQQPKSRVIHRTCGRSMTGERYCLIKVSLAKESEISQRELGQEFMSLFPTFAVGHTTGTLSATYCPKRTIEAANILPGEFSGKSTDYF